MILLWHEVVVEDLLIAKAIQSSYSILVFSTVLDVDVLDFLRFYQLLGEEIHALSVVASFHSAQEKLVTVAKTGLR